jgi:CRISPR system CASCADE complex protein casC
MSTYIDVHIVQNIPPSCVNRDDTGSPKSAMYGGVKRLRVSSQAWKHVTRSFFDAHLDREDLGTRTKRVVGILAKEIGRQAEDLENDAQKLAEEVFNAAKIKLSEPRAKKSEEASKKAKESGYLLFLSNRQIAQLAELAVESARSGEELGNKEVKRIFKSQNSIDVALFGRMVADDADLNVDAACQVAHAISTHAAENEFDFFTAVDDDKSRAEEREDAGAGMMGTIEFSSATMYRYATVNLDSLHENLGDAEATLRALTSFIEAFVKTMPTGKQNTFANRTLPSMVVVQVRDDQPVSLVGAFERPVLKNDTEGFVAKSVRKLVEHEKQLEEAFGVKPRHAFVVSLEDYEGTESLGERVAFNVLTDRVRDVVESRLPASE